MPDSQTKITPMYRQYLSIKEEYPDALLFYRMGDFYELFYEDAETASRELQLTLTSRSREEGGVPMCGVPWHACETYISQLVEKGYKIAICDQMEDPRQAKGLVKRAVTRVITSGTVIDDSNLEAKSHNYLGALCWNDGTSMGGFAWIDVSTGAWTGIASSRSEELRQWVLKLHPSELLVPDPAEFAEPLKKLPGVNMVRVPFRSHFELKGAEQRVLAAQHVQESSALGLEKAPALMQACGALVTYLEQMQKQDPAQLRPFRPVEKGAWLVIDEVTERNLELFRRLDGKKGRGTLWAVMDCTQTPMGGRLLEERMRCPWRQVKKILLNQESTAWLAAHRSVLDALRASLARVYDMERLSTRISLDRCQPRDMAALKESLAALPSVRAALEQEKAPDGPLPDGIGSILGSWDMMEDVGELLSSALVDELPVQITDGGIFRKGYDAGLDELMNLQEHGEGLLQELLAREQERNGLPRLKMGYNRVFGYYLELSRAQMTGPLPEHFQRRQSLANCDRFITPELKELEDKLLNASERRRSLEYRLYQELRKKLADERHRLVFMADALAHLDFWQSLAWAAVRNGWARPSISEDCSLVIRQGRHPVVEAITGRNAFVPNDLVMDGGKHLMLITGPNMAGKSTVLRQTAIIVLMAQMGSFVPASEASIGICDRIFSRVGASDNLSQGQSTFMVEMMETARILRQSGRRSLVILDEMGRGTSTFDGLSLAWAVVEELASRAGGSVRTLFATHYHELTSLASVLPGVYNMNIAVREWNGDIVFLRRLIPGPADRSYGIEVAKLAGVPPSVVQRARQVLAKLEKSRSEAKTVRVEASLLPGIELPSKNAGGKPPAAVQPAVASRHPLLCALDDVDPGSMTPIQALQLVSDWKMLWGGRKDDVSGLRPSEKGESASEVK